MTSSRPATQSIFPIQGPAVYRIVILPILYLSSYCFGSAICFGVLTPVVATPVMPAAVCVASDITPEEVQFFESKIRPVLIARCVECHNSEKHEGGLQLDSYDGLKRGGESGPIVPEDTSATPIDASNHFLRAINYADLEMPPNAKLPDREIEDLTQWLMRGAPWPKHQAVIAPSGGAREFTEDERSYWFFQPLPTSSQALLKNHQIPENVNPIDAFVESKLSTAGLAIAPNASRTVLARRIYLDLVGVPPTWEELQSVVHDTATDAVAIDNLIDRLLEDRRYGERWGRYWLDLVRYAESDGYKQDDFRPTSYRYRDYVIRSFNDDKPYGQFVSEQIAGDEIDPSSLEMKDAVGFLRLGIYEYNQRDVEGQWKAILNDITDVTGEAFLGLGYGCARCHDHKFDPLLQRDYYRLQSAFAAIMPRDDLPACDAEARSTYETQLAEWERRTADVRAKIAELEKPIIDRTVADGIEKFPPEVRPALRSEDSERGPYDKQIARLAYLQIQRDLNELKMNKRLKDDALTQWESLNAELEKLKAEKPKPLPMSLTVRDVGPEAPETWIPGAKSKGAILPGPPSILNPDPLEPTKPSESNLQTTGRRTALASWITATDNKLTWRVIVNRVWQHHFSTGIVVNASDFGKLTAPPTHPELLDWLASSFVEDGGRCKSLHRTILRSRVYRQTSYPESIEHGMNVDPSNRLLWRYTPRRMDAEQFRDSLLSVSGELKYDAGGPSDGPDSLRRSVYRRAKRNSPDPILLGFDGPDGSSSTAKRNSTTTSLQALMVANSNWTIDRSAALAKKIEASEDTSEKRVKRVFREVHLREPSESELSSAIVFVNQGNSLADLCHVLLSSNEFLFIE